jgi:ornithine carbamoyltransferase
MITNNIRHFINIDSIPEEILQNIMKLAHHLKKNKFTPPQVLQGLSLAMIFDKKSTRTRLSFEVAMKQLGGHTIEMQLGGAESIEDTAKVLSRFVDAVMIRISSHELVEELASFSTIPIINALTDKSHPCQIMADIMTIEEKLGSVKGKKLAWFGDYNNVAKTFVQAAPKFGFNIFLAVPEQFKPDQSLFTNNPYVTLGSDAKKAAENADVIITDTWVSMGQEGKSINSFLPYRVTSDLMGLAKQNAIFMHCMPIHRGEEVTDEVLNTPASVIYDEAENRLHVQKAILAYCLENSGVHVGPNQIGLFE